MSKQIALTAPVAHEPAFLRTILERVAERRARNKIYRETLNELRALSDRDLSEGVAIIYGAAHMRDMEARLVERFGYEPADGGWLTSMSVNLGKAGISPMEMEMIRTSIRQQISILRAQAERE